MLELNRRNILPRHQADFFEEKSTMYNILRLSRCVRQARDQSNHAVVIFFLIFNSFLTLSGTMVLSKK